MVFSIFYILFESDSPSRVEFYGYYVLKLQALINKKPYFGSFFFFGQDTLGLLRTSG